MSKKSKAHGFVKAQKQETKKVDANDHFLIPTWGWLLIIAFFTIAVYAQVFNLDFVDWDDPIYVLKNKMVVSNEIKFGELFKTNVASNYHPITMLSLALNYQLSELKPQSYHLVNLLIHLLNTGLVFFFILQLTKGNVKMAVWVSFFFGIHPMHVESVAWVSERKDVLYVFFFLSGLITYLYYQAQKKAHWYFITLALFLASCLSKGMAIVFPFILLLIDYRNEIKMERKKWVEKIPFFIIAIIFGVIAAKAQQEDHAMKNMIFLSFPERIIFANYGLWMYALKLFIPYKLCNFYPYSILLNSNGVPAIYYLIPLMSVLFLAFVAWKFRHNKDVIFGLSFYFISVVMVLQLVSIGGALMADRYSYLSYVGLLFMVASFFDRIWDPKSSLHSLKSYFTSLVLIAAIVFSFQTYARVQVWKNTETLFSDVIEKYPEVNWAYSIRGGYVFEKGDHKRALDDFNKSLELSKNSFFASPTKNVKAYNYKGVIFAEAQQFDSALVYFNKAIALDSKYDNAYDNRGIYYYIKGDFSNAIEDISMAIQLDSTNADYFFNRANVLMTKKEPQKSLPDYLKAIELNPKLPEYWMQLSKNYTVLGQNEQAELAMKRAQELGQYSDASRLK